MNPIDAYLLSHQEDLYWPYREREFFCIEDDLLLYKKDRAVILLSYLGFSDILVIPTFVDEVASYAFYNQKSLKKVVFLPGAKAIGSKAFSCMDALEEVILPKTLQVIHHQAFDCDASLKTVVFKTHDTFVEEEVFDHCYELDGVILDGDRRMVNKLAVSPGLMGIGVRASEEI